jgi:hypothetical protein
MSERPWLEDGDPALRTERDLLKRLNAEQPPSGALDHGWAALAAQIAVPPPIGTSGPTHAAPHAATGTAGLAAKIAVGIALAGGVLWGGSELTKPKSNAPSMPRPLAPIVSAPVPPHREPVVSPPAPALTAESPLSVPEPSVARRGASDTTLAEEGRLLAKAHQLVQSGQPQLALEVLRSSQSRYPRSVLSQEREVLTIEALYASGASGTAKHRAQQLRSCASRCCLRWRAAITIRQ